VRLRARSDWPFCWRGGGWPWLALGLPDCWLLRFGIVLISSKAAMATRSVEVTAIDVGQGDSLLLITPEGKTLLMDAGGTPGNARSDFDVGEEVVSPYLWSRGIRRLMPLRSRTPTPTIWVGCAA